MNNINRMDTRKTKCPKCGIYVSNLRKHKARGRCFVQHIRRKDRQIQKLLKKWGGESVKYIPKKEEASQPINAY